MVIWLLGRMNGKKEEGLFRSRTGGRNTALERLLAPVVWALLAPMASAQTLIDFERPPDGSPIADQTRLSQEFQPAGVVFEPDGVGPLAGALVLAEGTFGVVNFGNSQNKSMWMGGVGTSTIVRFVDPSTGVARPVARVRLRVGNGDVATESFTVTARDAIGQVLRTSGTVVTSTIGADFDCESCVPLIASVQLTMNIGSMSGAMMDDLQIWPSLPCPADVNCSGSVSVQDIFDFLAFYFAGGPSGDFNQSGQISVQDIFNFLGAYFAGCS